MTHSKIRRWSTLLISTAIGAGLLGAWFITSFSLEFYPEPSAEHETRYDTFNVQTLSPVSTELQEFKSTGSADGIPPVQPPGIPKTIKEIVSGLKLSSQNSEITVTFPWPYHAEPSEFTLSISQDLENWTARGTTSIEVFNLNGKTFGKFHLSSSEIDFRFLQLIRTYEDEDVTICTVC